jgi:general secretion pathway protein I
VTKNKALSVGFTLIEVLAALVIVALGMLGAIQAVTQVAGNGAYLRDKSFANWIAMNRITEVRLAPKAPEIGDTKGELDYGGQRWRWKMNVSKTAEPSMLRIDMDVAPADAPDKTALASISGFYGTAMAPQPAIVVWDQQAASNPAAGGGGNVETPQTPATLPPIPTVQPNIN